MKNVIFQYYLDFNGVGKQEIHYANGGVPEWAKCSSKLFAEYAKKHNADYFFLEDRYVNATSNFFEVTRLFKDPMFDKYDKLLYCDVDVIPKNMDANIFDVLGDHDFAGWPEQRMYDLIVDINCRLWFKVNTIYTALWYTYDKQWRNGLVERGTFKSKGIF